MSLTTQPSLASEQAQLQEALADPDAWTLNATIGPRLVHSNGAVLWIQRQTGCYTSLVFEHIGASLCFEPQGVGIQSGNVQSIVLHISDSVFEKSPSGQDDDEAVLWVLAQVGRLHYTQSGQQRKAALETKVVKTLLQMGLDRPGSYTLLPTGLFIAKGRGTPLPSLKNQDLLQEWFRELLGIGLDLNFFHNGTPLASLSLSLSIPFSAHARLALMQTA